MTIRECRRSIRGAAGDFAPCKCPPGTCELHPPTVNRPSAPGAPLAIVGYTDTESAEAQESLRALRAWHWREAMFYRAAAKRCKRPYARNQNDAIADRHIAHVQTLNAFFPVNDTAERDCMEGRV